MGYSRKRKGSDEAGEEVAATKRSKSGDSLPTKQSDNDGNAYWEVRSPVIEVYHTMLTHHRSLGSAVYRSLSSRA
jgi:hypothetical protein